MFSFVFFKGYHSPVCLSKSSSHLWFHAQLVFASLTLSHIYLTCWGHVLPERIFSMESWKTFILRYLWHWSEHQTKELHPSLPDILDGSKLVSILKTISSLIAGSQHFNKNTSAGIQLFLISAILNVTMDFFFIQDQMHLCPPVDSLYCPPSMRVIHITVLFCVLCLIFSKDMIQSFAYCKNLLIFACCKLEMCILPGTD